MNRLPVVARVFFLVLFLFPLTTPADAAFDSPLLPPDAPAPEDMTTENILIWILSGGCGVLAFFVIEKLAGAWFHNQTPEIKQYLASGISGSLAVLAFVGLVALGVKDAPGEIMAWVDAVLPVFFTGAGFANLTHAKLVLSGK